MSILQNPRYEIFALAIARGEFAYAAYQLAGYTPHRQNAARLMTNDDIKARVREIQRAAATATTLTIREKREFFARLVRARLSEVPDDSDLWQEFRITVEGSTRKLLDNDLSGERSEAKREGVTVVVTIGGQDNYETPFIPERPLRLLQGDCVHAGKRA